MSKKYFDEFTRLTLTKMAEKMSDMTYEFKNTEVPNTHYRKILQTEMIEMLAQDSSMELLLLNAVVSQLKSLEKESPKLFFKALLCINENINIEKINSRIYDSLELTYINNVNEKKLFSEKISEDYKENYKQHSEVIEEDSELLS